MPSFEQPLGRWQSTGLGNYSCSESGLSSSRLCASPVPAAEPSAVAALAKGEDPRINRQYLTEVHFCGKVEETDPNAEDEQPKADYGGNDAMEVAEMDAPGDQKANVNENEIAVVAGPTPEPEGEAVRHPDD